jgi:hypothetical protein
LYSSTKRCAVRRAREDVEPFVLERHAKGFLRTYADYLGLDWRYLARIRVAPSTWDSSSFCREIGDPLAGAEASGALELLLRRVAKRRERLLVEAVCLLEVTDVRGYVVNHHSSLRQLGPSLIDLKSLEDDCRDRSTAGTSA